MSVRKSENAENHGPSKARKTEDSKITEKVSIGPLITTPLAPGKVGKPSPLLSNTFGVTWPLPHIHRYVIDFDPPIDPGETFTKRRTVGRFHQQLQAMFGIWVYDGASLLSPIAVKGDSTVIKSETDSGTLIIRPTKTIDTSKTADLQSQEVLTVVNIWLKKYLRLLELRQIGRHYFEEKSALVPEYRLVIYKGYSASIELTSMGLRLVASTVHRIVRQETVRDVMERIRKDVEHRNGKLSSEERRLKLIHALHAELKGAAVLTSYNNRLWRIDLVDLDRDISSTFKLKTGEDISFRKYYVDKYGVSMDSVLPGVLVHLPSKASDQEMVLIPELCHLTGLSDEMKSNVRLMKAVAAHTNVSSQQKLQHLHQLAKMLVTSEKIKTEINPNPIAISLEFKRLAGRILGPYQVTLKKGGKVMPVRTSSSFQREFSEASMMSSIRCSKFVIMCTESARAPTSAFLDQMLKHADDGGLSGAWESELKSVIDQEAPHLICAILPSDSLYATFKRITIVQCGILSQAVRLKTIQNDKRLFAVAKNVLSQMLTKLGGVPWQVSFDLPNKSVPIGMQPTMVIGVDAVLDKKHGLQAVGFCASYSRDFCSYHSYVSFQSTGVDVLLTAKELMKRALTDFNKRFPLPLNIIVYRDGVPPTQFSGLLQREIQGFMDAFNEVKQNYKPKMTVVVVQKRSQIQFFGQSPVKSPTPISVIDSQITSPLYSEFYLVSTVPLGVGTAHPTRYIVVWNDCKFTTDDIEAFTAQFCLLYFNFPGGVRVPAPCLYANKLCYLIVKHLENNEPHQQLNGLPYYL